MQYFSTNNKNIKADFRKATLQGQPIDKGLYFPERIPTIDKELIREIEKLSNEEIAFRVIKPYTGNSIPDDILFSIVTNLSFPLTNNFS